MSEQNNIESCCAGACAPEEKKRSTRSYRPNVDIAETADAFHFTADLPGTEPDGISVTFENGLLTLSGTVSPRQTDADRFLLREYGVGDFARSFEIHEKVDPAAISAELSAGVLTVTVPKAAEVQPKRIQVKVNSSNLN